MSGKFDRPPDFFSRLNELEVSKTWQRALEMGAAMRKERAGQIDASNDSQSERDRLAESSYWASAGSSVVVPIMATETTYRPDFEAIFRTCEELKELADSIDQESADKLTKQLCSALKDTCTELTKLATYCMTATRAAVEAKKALADV